MASWRRIPTLATALNSTYSFGITSNASISTEGGAVQIESSIFFGVLTPFRNNQTDVNNPAYTGAIRGFDIQHILLASDTAYMPVARSRARSRIADSSGPPGMATATRRAARSGPTQAPQIPFAWHNGTPTYPMHVDPLAELPGAADRARRARAPARSA